MKYVQNSLIRTFGLIIALQAAPVLHAWPDWPRLSDFNLKSIISTPLTVPIAGLLGTGTIGYLCYRWRINRYYEESNRAIAFAWGLDAFMGNREKLIKNGIDRRLLEQKAPGASTDHFKKYTEDECGAEYHRLNEQEGRKYSSLYYPSVLKQMDNEDSWESLKKQNPDAMAVEGKAYFEGPSFDPEYYNLVQSDSNDKKLEKLDQQKRLVTFQERQLKEYNLVSKLEQQGFSKSDAIEIMRAFKEHMSTVDVGNTEGDHIGRIKNDYSDPLKAIADEINRLESADGGVLGREPQGASEFCKKSYRRFYRMRAYLQAEVDWDKMVDQKKLLKKKITIYDLYHNDI